MNEKKTSPTTKAFYGDMKSPTTLHKAPTILQSRPTNQPYFQPSTLPHIIILE